MQGCCRSHQTLFGLGILSQAIEELVEEEPEQLKEGGAKYESALGYGHAYCVQAMLKAGPKAVTLTPKAASLVHIVCGRISLKGKS